MTYHDSANLHLIDTVGYGDSEIVLRDGSTTILAKLHNARRIIADPAYGPAMRAKAADLLERSWIQNDQDLAEHYRSVWQCKRERKAAAFVKLNKGTLRRDALDDVRGNAFTWVVVAFVLLCAVLTLPHGIADVLPNAIAAASAN